ncbi:MAG: MarR family winged helix-turn-helix transcriptional regulator [Hyphomicrobiaceae bacterium]
MADVTQASSQLAPRNNAIGPAPSTVEGAGQGGEHEQTSRVQSNLETGSGDRGLDVSPDDLISYAELLFFAYRDFVGEPDAILETYGFGRAHHRVLHFVRRSPGLRVAQLLTILKITKQSLARVLKQLIDEGFITQQAGKLDGRERLLYTTPKGGKLADELAALQVARIKSALQQAGAGTDDATRRFLYAMISEDERHHVASLVPPSCDCMSSDNDPTND